MRILSLGWGVQSWALAAMSALGELPRVDYAIHSDTTFERSATYAFAEEWTPWLEDHGVKVVRVCDPDAVKIMLDDGGQAHAPFYTLAEDGKIGRLRRSCTSRWKIGPIRSYINRCRQPGEQVEQWLGISKDEWHRAKDADVKYITNRYPLLELGMSRLDCLTWLAAHNLSVPVKSSCTFCPFHSNKAWQEMKREGGADWEQAILVDLAVRRVRPNYTTFVSRSCKPLDEAVVIPDDFGYSQLDLLASDDGDAECDSGYCFL